MLICKTNFKSIFDIIEEAEAVPTILQWKEANNSLQIPTEPAIKYKGQTTCTEGTVVERFYLVIPFYLVRIINNRVQCLPLTNARISKITDTMKHAYGIRITGYKGKDEICLASMEDQNALYTEMKKYCVMFHLMNEFNLIKVIGRGNFSKVHLGSKLGINAKYAIKSIEKSKILENSRSMVNT